MESLEVNKEYISCFHSLPRHQVDIFDGSSNVHQLVINPSVCKHGGFLNTRLFSIDLCYRHVIISPFHNFKGSDGSNCKEVNE